MSTWAFRLLLLAAAVLGAMAVYRFAATRASTSDAAERLVVDPPERDLGEVPAGIRTVDFKITNTGTRDRRIVGMSGSACIPNCCFGPKEPFKNVPLPPGETFVYQCELDVKGTGPFEAPIKVYVDDNGLRTIEIKVRGVGIASK